MRIYLIAIGTRLPAWVQDAYTEFSQRISGDCSLELIEIPMSTRQKSSNTDRLMQEECKRLLAAIPKNCRFLTLDSEGVQWDTASLAKEMKEWLSSGSDMALLVGGPDGLAPECRKAAEGSWSLSKLTLPHPLVRVVVAEQLYRAQCILRNHPYHR